MKAIVVDASVAVKWVVEEQHSAEAALLLQCETLHAPDHWQAEAVNALWAKVAKADLPTADAEEGIRLLLRAPVSGTPIRALIARAFAISLAQSVTVYDSLYVALAEKLDIPFVTADQKLIRRMAGQAGNVARARWIGDFALPS